MQRLNYTNYIYYTYYTKHSAVEEENCDIHSFT